MTHDEVESHMKRRAAVLTLAFNTDAMRKALEVLQDMFNPHDLRAERVEDTYYNLGARDLLVFLNRIADGEDE